MGKTNNLQKNSKLITQGLILHLQEFGFAIAKNIIPSEECNLISEDLDQCEKKHKTGKKPIAQELVTSYGQTIIRDIHLEVSAILPLIDLSVIWDVVSETLNDTPIIDGCVASRSGSNDGLIHMDGHLRISEFINTTDIVAIVCLDDFTETNGSTRVWPLSHKSGKRPQNDFAPDCKIPGGIDLLAPEGSVIFILGQTWHQIKKNIDNKRRWAILIHYKKWWIKPGTDYTQCGVRMYNQLTLRQKILFGFNSRPPIDLTKRYKTLISEDLLTKKYDELLKH